MKLPKFITALRGGGSFSTNFIEFMVIVLCGMTYLCEMDCGWIDVDGNTDDTDWTDGQDSFLCRKWLSAFGHILVIHLIRVIRVPIHQHQ
jgi:hypothetical protein